MIKFQSPTPVYAPDCADCPTPAECKVANDCAVMRQIRHPQRPRESRNDEDTPYFIEVDQNGCAHCDSGRTWGVVGPDCAALGTTWDNAQDAQDMADLLNTAFHFGKTSPSEMGNTGQRAATGMSEVIAASAANPESVSGHFTPRAGAAHQLAEDFGDPHTLLNSRDWLDKALKAAGAKITGGGCGVGQADTDIVLEGCKFNVSIRPL